MNRNKVLLLLGIVVAVMAFFYFDLHQYFTLEAVKAQRQGLVEQFQANPVKIALAFFGVYVAVAALSLPGALLLTLLGGAIFGLLWGTVIVSFASSVGATLAFLASRFILRDSIKAKFGDKLAAIDEGIKKEGAFYLFSLRLIPAFPFFVVNLIMGLTSMRAATFYWVSQIGMLLGTIIYVNVGTQLAGLTSLKGILNPGLLISFVLLGLAPLLAKKIIDMLKSRKIYAAWKKPTHFDRNIVVIGGGSAGLVTSLIAAAVKAKVTLVEKHEMGGDCLNTGCVPSKALIKSAKLVEQARHAEHYGLQKIDVKFDFAQVMERVQTVIKKIAPHDSIERFTGLGVDCLRGEATIKSPWEVEVKLLDEKGRPTGKTEVLTTKNIVIATGARPFVPPIPGIDQVGYYTSDTLWGIREQPKRLLVLGGGPIGCELSQAFNRLGSKVTQVERAPRLMIREDSDVSAEVMKRFVAEGIDVRVGYKAVEFKLNAGEKILVTERTAANGGVERVEIAFDAVLCAVGRSARVSGFGLEDLKIPLGKTRTIEVNEFLETHYPNIFVAGDAAGPYQFTHTAAHMAWYAAVNALFGKFKKFKVDYRVIPWCTFTEPEVARVGLNEQDAKAKGIAYESTVYHIDDLDRAIADGSDYGFVKVLTVPGKDKILGATIVGEHAGDLIAEYVAAMKHGLGLKKILGTIHIYPTLAESNKYAAGEWQKAHAPQKLLAWVEKFHAWSRA